MKVNDMKKADENMEDGTSANLTKAKRTQLFKKSRAKQIKA